MVRIRSITGPAVSVAAMLIAVSLGSFLPPVTCGSIAGLAWLAGFGLLLFALWPRFPANLVVARITALLVVYALLLAFIDPSTSGDGNIQSAVIASAAWLIPAAVGGVALPRGGHWLPAVGCWCLLFSLSLAVSATVYHRNVMIGVMHRVWD